MGLCFIPRVVGGKRMYPSLEIVEEGTKGRQTVKAEINARNFSVKNWFPKTCAWETGDKAEACC